MILLSPHWARALPIASPPNYPWFALLSARPVLRSHLSLDPSNRFCGVSNLRIQAETIRAYLSFSNSSPQSYRLELVWGRPNCDVLRLELGTTRYHRESSTISVHLRYRVQPRKEVEDQQQHRDQFQQARAHYFVSKTDSSEVQERHMK